MTEYAGSPAAAEGDALSIGRYLGLWLPPAVVADGSVTGGVIRRAHSILLTADYVQTVPPVDEAVHPGVRVNWHAVLQDAGVGFGPVYGAGGEGWFGPPGVYDVKGLVEIGADQSTFSFTPIGFANVLRVRNVPGADRIITPAWRFMEASILFADAATVTLQKNDINSGGAAFVDSQFLATANDGVLDGVTNDVGVTSLLSAPVVLGHTRLAFRHAVDVFDTNTYLGLPGSEAFEAFLDAHGLVPGADAVGGGTIDRQVGIRIRALTNATVNIGIENESATVERFLDATLDSTASTIPTSATAVALTNATGATLVSTAEPFMAPGEDGQRITLLNVSEHAIVFGTTPAGGLLLHGPQLTLARGDAALFVYSRALERWVELSGRSSSSAALVRSGAYAFPAAGARTTTRLEPGRLDAVPFVVGRALVVDRLAVEVVNEADPGATCRLGIYANGVTDDAPGALLYESAPITVDGGPGVREATEVGLALSAGLHWLAIVADTPSLTIRAFTGGQPVADAAFGPEAQVGYVRPVGPGGLPDSFGAPESSVTVAPLIGLAPR